jgi:hypothetical protein
MKGNPMFLTASLARQTAEAQWGRGGTTSYKTNRKGAYYFSCSSHGGFVISAKALSDTEYEEISKYASPEVMTVYVDNDTDNVLLAFQPFRRNSGKLRGVGSSGYRIEKEEIFLLEEDCDWALAVKFAGIMVKDMTKEAADKTFFNWFDIKNPAVAASKKIAELRKNGDNDLIVSASGLEGGLVKVWTADKKTYVVRGYDRARDEFGTPWLSRCEVVELNSV